MKTDRQCPGCAVYLYATHREWPHVLCPECKTCADDDAEHRLDVSRARLLGAMQQEVAHG